MTPFIYLFIYFEIHPILSTFCQRLLLVRRPEGKDFAFIEFSSSNAARVVMENSSGEWVMMDIWEKVENDGTRDRVMKEEVVVEVEEDERESVSVCVCVCLWERWREEGMDTFKWEMERNDTYS